MRHYGFLCGKQAEIGWNWVNEKMDMLKMILLASCTQILISSSSKDIITPNTRPLSTTPSLSLYSFWPLSLLWMFSVVSQVFSYTGSEIYACPFELWFSSIAISKLYNCSYLTHLPCRLSVNWQSLGELSWCSAAWSESNMVSFSACIWWILVIVVFVETIPPQGCICEGIILVQDWSCVWRENIVNIHEVD